MKRAAAFVAIMLSISAASVGGTFVAIGYGVSGWFLGVLFFLFGFIGMVAGATIATAIIGGDDD